MGYLVLTRKIGESLNLSLRPGADSAELLDQLRTDGINIDVLELRGRQVQLAVDAPDALLVLRDELLDGT
ncbi:carbon storage regulator [Pseudomonas sp. PA15(2017)]|uniref:carbon storage regulator n=1 Tax=Pseudomonas sp. PA15(2017) TaxID=1932111 RepID=UPI0009695F92|nr:carbon storage regulator [Pseudomonas sp. PA15(2017)]OLU25673.1 carbon storage regulator [Pseudomonas sp. PA15(2017)]